MNGLCENDSVTEEDEVVTVRSVRGGTRHIRSIHIYRRQTQFIYVNLKAVLLGLHENVNYVATRLVRHHVPCTKAKDLSTSFPFSA